MPCAIIGMPALLYTPSLFPNGLYIAYVPSLLVLDIDLGSPLRETSNSPGTLLSNFILSFINFFSSSESGLSFSM